MDGIFVLAHFTRNNAPATGLSPVLSAWRLSDQVQIINESLMTPLNTGFGGYVFDFFPFYDPGEDYSIVMDGDPGADESPPNPQGLSNAERYLFASTCDLCGNIDDIGFSDTILEVTFVNPTNFSDTVVEVTFRGGVGRGLNLYLEKESRFVDERLRKFSPRRQSIEREETSKTPRRKLDKTLRKPHNE